jgi:hypothetical protein
VLHPAISVNKTVGTETGLCASHDAIGVTANAQVVYCYRVTNVGDVALTTHVLTDTRLGRILSGSHHLAPGASWFITRASVLTRTTVNTAVWVASAGDHVATATDSAMVAVIVPAVQINQIIPNPSWFLEDVLFDGSGTPTTTTSLLEEYEWTRIPASATCGDYPTPTLLGTAARIRDNTIPVGTHRICLRGKTYNDVWSGYVMTTTTVRPDRWAFSDIAVGPKSVSFWKDPSAQDDPVYNPDVGDTVYVKVEVHNISIHDTPDEVTVTFYTGTITASLYVPITGTLIGTNTIASIAAQTSQFVTIPWTITGKVGYRPFAVDVGYTENISYFAHHPLPPYTEPYSETDYTNNRVIGAIPVGHVTGTYGISVTAGVLPIHQPKLYAGYPAYVSGSANYAWDVLLATMGATTTIRVSDWSGVAVACWKTYRTWTTSPLGDYRVTIPLPYKPGVYQARVAVDDGNLSGAQVVTFTVSEPPKPLPDLYIERFSVLLSGPNTYVRTWDDYTFQRVYHRSRLFGIQSQPITITARVHNGGNLAVPGSFAVSFYDGTPGDGGTRIGTEIINGLAAGAAKRIEHVWTPARTGIHVIQAVVDEANQIDESNETNNYDDYYYTYQACFNDVASRRCHDAAHRDIIEVRAANPDLRALGLNYAEPDLGDVITMTVDIHNIGHRDIITSGGVFTFTVYDGYPNVGVASTRMLTAPGELGPTRAVSLYRGTHRTYDVVWNTGYTGTVPGLHHICVEVDTGAEIAEEIEENNVNCWDLYVFPNEADLEPYELTYSNNCPLPNETITITAHFMNMGAQVFTPTEVVTFYHTSITPTHVTATATISGPIAGHRGTGTTITQVMAPGSHGTTYIFVEYIKTNGSYNLGPHRYARRLNICKMPPPNLRILSGDIHVNPRSPTSDEPVSVAVDVANVSQSSIATATDFIVEFHTSGPTAGYHELGQPRTVASLGPGMITTVLASTPFAMADKFYAVQASAWPRVEQGDEYYGDNETTTSIVQGNAKMLALTATVGITSGVCTSTDAITVNAGTPVFYCYQMTNQGEVHLSVHDVYDDKFGNVLSGYAYDLSQGETFTWVQQVNLARTTASTATWVASTDPYTFIGTDTTKVNVKHWIYLPVVRKASGN